MNLKKTLAVAAAAFLAAVPALAANPFSDVPKGHWAYDAVAQLAARGILEGYPNGTFRGSRAMTRYEIAQMVARVMANGGGSGGELAKLIAEFAPELKALGVRVEGFDARVSKMEKDLGGWRISGEMRFDFNSYKKDFKAFGGDAPGHGFVFDKARLFLHRDLTDGVMVDIEYSDGVFDRWWFTAEDFLGRGGLTLKAGQFDIDFEGDDGLYYKEHEDHGLFMGRPYRGAQLMQDFGLGEIGAFAASTLCDDGISVNENNEDGEYYGLRFRFSFGERIWLSSNYYISKPGEDAKVGVDDFKVWWLGAGYKFGEGVELKGAFYKQKFDASRIVNGHDIDDAKAWKAILNVDQDVLRFTSLWLEYASFDEGFVTERLSYAFHASFKDWYEAATDGVTFPADTKVLFVALKQQWNEKWSTFERYAHYDFDDAGIDKIKDWAVGVGYQYTPDLYFELAYNRIDTGDNVPKFTGVDFKKGDIIRFRTLLSF